MSFRLFQVRDDVEFIKTYEGGQVRYLLKDGVSGAYFALKFLQFEILRYFRKKAKTAEDCAQYMIDRFDVEIEPDQIAAFVSGMRSKNVLKIDHHYPLSALAIASIRVKFKERIIQELKKHWEKSPPSEKERSFYSELLSLLQQNRVYDVLTSLETAARTRDDAMLADLRDRLHRLIVQNIQWDRARDPIESAKKPFDRALTEEVKSVNPMPLLIRWRSWIRVVFSPYFMLPILAFCVFSGYLIVREEKGCFTCFADNTIYFFNNFALAFVIGHVMSVCHEFGHAMVCYYFGGRVDKMGVIMFYGYIPTLYADVTDAYRMRRYQRILISMAGAGVEFILGMIAGFGMLFTEYDSFAYRVFWMIWCIGVSSILPNYLPAFKNDGYYIATDILRVDNLFSKSFGYCLLRIRSLFSGETVDTREYPVQERGRLWAFFIYLCAQYAALVILLQHVAQSSMEKTLGLIPRIFLFLLLVRVLYALLGMLIRSNPMAWIEALKKYKRAWALAFVVAFFFLPVSNDLELDAEVAAERVLPIRSPMDGAVSSIHFASDRLLPQRSSLLTLRSDETAGSFEKARWDFSKQQSLLGEVSQGMSREEIAALNASIDARRETLSHLQKKWDRYESARDLISPLEASILQDRIKNETLRLSLEIAARKKKEAEFSSGLPILEKNVEISGMALQVAREQLDERYLYAPIDGYVHQENLSNLIGRKFSKGDVIVEILSSSRCVFAEIPENEVGLIPSNASARLVTETGKRLDLRLRALSNTPYEHLVGAHRFSIFSEPRKLKAEFAILSDVSDLRYGETGRIVIDRPKRTVFMKLFGRRVQNVWLSLWKNS